MALQDVLECDSGLKPGGKSPFWVANDTGVVVSFWLAPSLQAAWKRPPGEHLTAHHCDPCPQQMNSCNVCIIVSSLSCSNDSHCFRDCQHLRGHVVCSLRAGLSIDQRLTGWSH